MEKKKWAQRLLITSFAVIFIVVLIVWYLNRDILLCDPAKFLTEVLTTIGGFLQVGFGFILLNLYWKGLQEEVTLKKLSPSLLRSITTIKENSYYLGELEKNLDTADDLREYVSQIKQHINAIHDQSGTVKKIQKKMKKSLDAASIYELDTTINDLLLKIGALDSVDLKSSNPDGKLFNINRDVGIIANVLFNSLIKVLIH